MKRLALLLVGVTLLSGYSVLTHESLIDAVWDREFKTALLARFPNATPAELREAHAFAYGGSLIQDMGYYPFSDKLFSDLVHYVRTGQYVQALLRDARDLNEYSFALGALAHYAGDTKGHPIGVNPSVALIYPKLGRRYGGKVTYEENPKRHLQTEFAFDVVQVAKTKYAPEAYHDFVGFEVSKRLLEQAFQETYGLALTDFINREDLAIGTVRYTVSTIIPAMTKVAWATKRKEIEALSPGVTRSRFLYRMSRVSYEKDWGREYRRPGWGARFLAFLFRILPKVGPLRALAFRPPTPQAERLFLQSLDSSLSEYRRALAELPQTPDLADRNLDTGEATAPARYRLADDAVRSLLAKHASQQFQSMTPRLREYLVRYLAGWKEWPEVRKHRKDWQKTGVELGALEAWQPAATPATSAAYQ